MAGEGQDTGSLFAFGGGGVAPWDYEQWLKQRQLLAAQNQPPVDDAAAQAQAARDAAAARVQPRYPTAQPAPDAPPSRLARAGDIVGSAVRDIATAGPVRRYMDATAAISPYQPETVNEQGVSNQEAAGPGFGKSNFDLMTTMMGVPMGGTARAGEAVLGAGPVRRLPPEAPAAPAAVENPTLARAVEQERMMPPKETTGDIAAKAIQSPAIISRAEPTPMDIAAVKAAAVRFGRKGWPTAENEVFKTTPEAYAETTQLVPQVSIRNKLPGPLPGEPLPNKGRADPIVANTEAISDRIAERLQPLVDAGSPLLKFYHTAPVIRGLERYGGMDIPQANTFMRDWAGQGAATSPRTQTPPNLRNSSYLLSERAAGNPLTPERYAAEGNTPGFPMMGMHVDLADKFARGVENPWVNPKPTTFRENWSGNLRDPTGDTHNIRSTLYEMDQVAPGQLPRGWFSSDTAYAKYRNDGFLAVDPGDFVDTLGGRTVNKQFRQSEYLPMVQPWYRAAEKLGLAPAEAQSGGWFSYGPITGLQSPPKTITNLLNDQIAATAKELNVSPEKVAEWWARSKIPLAGVAGGLGLGDLAAQATRDNNPRQ